MFLTSCAESVRGRNNRSMHCCIASPARAIQYSECVVSTGSKVTSVEGFPIQTCINRKFFHHEAMFPCDPTIFRLGLLWVSLWSGGLYMMDGFLTLSTTRRRCEEPRGFCAKWGPTGCPPHLFCFSGKGYPWNLGSFWVFDTVNGGNENRYILYVNTRQKGIERITDSGPTGCCTVNCVRRCCFFHRKYPFNKKLLFKILVNILNMKEYMHREIDVTDFSVTNL